MVHDNQDILETQQHELANDFNDTMPLIVIQENGAWSHGLQKLAIQEAE